MLNKRSASWLARFVGACALAGTLVAFAAAQQQQPPDPPPEPMPEAPEGEPAAGQEPPGVPSGEDVAQGVFVRDSAIAVDQFSLAERMERLRDWSKAAEIYQEVITRFGDRLIADRVDADAKVYQYASVGRAVQRKLAAWPTEGRAVYEQKFGTQAGALLDQAGDASPADIERLQTIVRLFFATQAGREAAMMLIDRHLADGSFAAAKRLSRELLEMHPAADEQRAAALLRALTAAHFVGDEELAGDYAQEIQQQFPQAMVSIAGEQKLASEAAAEVLAASLTEIATGQAGDWPSFGGADDRARLAPALSSQIAPYIGDLRVPETRVGDRPIPAPYRKDLENARLNGQLTGIFPVAYDGALYWGDGVHIYAVALDSGLPLPGWVETYGSGSDEGLVGYSLPGGGYVTPRGVALTPTVTENCVLANLGLRDERLHSGAGSPAIGSARLVCLDRLTGRPLWSRAPAELEARLLSDAALQADLGECQFVGAPLVVGDTVWTLARTDPLRGRQFEQSFLVGLDLETGDTRAITYLASSTGADPMARWGGQRNILPEPASILAYADGLIYAPTDTGAIAAVRASDGGVEWLNLYPRIPVDPISRRFTQVRLRVRTHTESQPFHAAPVIVEGGYVFFKPPDATHLFIWNAADGDEVTRVDLSELAGDRTLLKVIDNLVLTFGSQGVTCIDWMKLAEGKTRREWLQWASPIPPRDGADTQDLILGRPAVTQTQLLVPTWEHLRVVQLSDGRAVATYPTGGATWAEGEEAGNVIVVQDQLVIAGPSRLNIYADSGVIRERLQQQIAANPQDAAPLLRLAQIAFVAGDFDGTVDRLRQAEQIAPSGAQQASVFASALSFAQTLSERLGNALAPGSPTPETVERFFTQAERFARSPAQNVRVRFARAAFVRSQGAPQQSVAMLQEILTEPSWRQVPVVPEGRDSSLFDSESVTPRQAGDVARELLAQIISTSGPQVYEQIEQRAATDVSEARAAGDVEALQRVADIYPNSHAARDALSQAAQMLQQQGRVREAAAALRRLAARSEDALSASLTLAQIEAGRPERLATAAGRMRRAARSSPDAPAPVLTLPDGTALERLTVEQASFKLTEAALAAEVRRLPDLKLPDDPEKQLFASDPVVVQGIDAMLVPLESFERHDRIIARRTDGTVALFEFGNAEPLWSVSMDPSSAESAAWLPQGLLVWGAGAVVLLDAQTGEVQWRRAVEALAPAGSDQRSAQRPVVATGWRPSAAELDAGEAESLAQQRLQERAFEQQGGRGAWRRRELLRAQERREAINEQRRANEDHASEQAAPALTIQEVVPSAGMIAVILGPASSAVAGVLPENGDVQWRAPLPEGEIIAAHADGNFLAIHSSAARSVLNVLDMDSGSLVTRRSFDPGGADLLAFLVTLENELIYVTRQQLSGVDLEKQPHGTRFSIRPETLGEAASTFSAAAGPGRLRVVGEKLLVMVDPHRVMDQGPRRDALVVDLAKGRPQTFTDPSGTSQVMVVLSSAEAGAGEDPDMFPPRLRNQQRARLLQAQREAAMMLSRPIAPGERIWAAGTSVYLSGDRGLSAYDLAVPGRHWNRLNTQLARDYDPAVNLEVAIGKDDLLLFDQPLGNPQRQVAQPTVRVTSFSRDRLKDGRESGQERGVVELVPGSYGLEATVAGFQAAEGGVAVLSNAGQLVFLRGGE